MGMEGGVVQEKKDFKAEVENLEEDIEDRQDFINAIQSGSTGSQRKIQREYGERHNGEMLQMDTTGLQREVGELNEQLYSAKLDLLEDLKGREGKKGKKEVNEIIDLESALNERQLKLADMVMKEEDLLPPETGYHSSAGEGPEIKRREIKIAQMKTQIERIQEVLRMKY